MFNRNKGGDTRKGKRKKKGKQHLNLYPTLNTSHENYPYPSSKPTKATPNVTTAGVTDLQVSEQMSDAKSSKSKGDGAGDASAMAGSGSGGLAQSEGAQKPETTGDGRAKAPPHAKRQDIPDGDRKTAAKKRSPISDSKKNQEPPMTNVRTLGRPMIQRTSLTTIFPKIRTTRKSRIITRTRK